MLWGAKGTIFYIHFPISIFLLLSKKITSKITVVVFLFNVCSLPVLSSVNLTDSHTAPAYDTIIWCISSALLIRISERGKKRWATKNHPDSTVNSTHLWTCIIKFTLLTMSKRERGWNLQKLHMKSITIHHLFKFVVNSHSVGRSAHTLEASVILFASALCAEGKWYSLISAREYWSLKGRILLQFYHFPLNLMTLLWGKWQGEGQM